MKSCALLQNPYMYDMESTDADNAPAPFYLPDDKDYHLFFSYESTDRIWVEDCLQTLEGAPHHLKCCYDSRDFLGSRDVLGNIGELMSKSMTVLFLLSPEHTDSAYCIFEANIAFQLKQEMKLRIIPVLLRGDESLVPLSFRFINYIDARPGVEPAIVLEKIIKAIRQGPDTGNTSDVLAPQEVNGNSVNIAVKTGKGKTLKAKLRRSLEEITDQHISACRTMGSQVPQSVLADIRDLLNDTSLLRYCHVTRTSLGVFLLTLAGICITGGLLLLTTAASLLALNRDDTESFSIMLGCVLTAGAVAMVVALLGWYAVQKVDNRMLGKCLKKTARMSQCLFESYNTIVVLNTAGNPPLPSVGVVKYNTSDCQAVIAGLLRNDESYRHATGELIQQASKKIIYDAIPEYSQILGQQEPKAAVPRHNVCDDVICLCQYVEKCRRHPNNSPLKPDEPEETRPIL